MSCLEHLHICKAECCKEFSIIVGKLFVPPTKGDKIIFKCICTRDMAFYYKLHGATYKHGVLCVELNDFEVKDNIIYVYNICDGLTEDLQCKYHDTDKQPKICHRPNKDNKKDGDGIHITPNCLWQIK